LRGGAEISELSSTASPHGSRKTNAEAEVPRYLRHCPEKDMHRFPGCLTDFTSDNDKTVLPSCL
jgi:hypothetical protein